MLCCFRLMYSPLFRRGGQDGRGGDGKRQLDGATRGLQLSLLYTRCGGLSWALFGLLCWRTARYPSTDAHGLDAGTTNGRMEEDGNAARSVLVSRLRRGMLSAAGGCLRCRASRHLPYVPLSLCHAPSASASVSSLYLPAVTAAAPRSHDFIRLLHRRYSVCILAGGCLVPYRTWNANHRVVCHLDVEKYILSHRMLPLCVWFSMQGAVSPFAFHYLFEMSFHAPRLCCSACHIFRSTCYLAQRTPSAFKPSLYVSAYPCACAPSLHCLQVRTYSCLLCIIL